MRTIDLARRIKSEFKYLRIREIIHMIRVLTAAGEIIPLFVGKNKLTLWSSNPLFAYYTGLLVDTYEDDLIDWQVEDDARYYTPSTHVFPWRSCDPGYYDVVFTPQYGQLPYD